MSSSVCKIQLVTTPAVDQTPPEPRNQMVPEGAADHREEHRRDPRIAVDDPGLMRVVNAESVFRTVRILDVSKRGMKLWVPEFVPPGTTVQVRVKDLRVLGGVCFCVAAAAGFKAGISIENVFERLLGQPHEAD